MPNVRKMIFNLRSITDYRRTPPSLLQKVGEQFAWYRQIILEVNYPPEAQLSTAHPKAMKQLLQDVPQLSVVHGGLSCGMTGDFGSEIQEDTHGESLGHVWEHVAAHAFDEVSSRLGYGDHQFVWRTEVVKQTSSSIIYKICAFHEVKPPGEFFGLELLVCGYVNALFEGKAFRFGRRVDDFVEHRVEKTERQSLLKRFLFGILGVISGP